MPPARRLAGAARRAAIRTAVDLLPTDRAGVFYNSFGGHFSDSPRAIFEELVRQGRPMRHVWRMADGREADFPPGVATVRPGTVAHMRCLGRAGHVITNTWLYGIPKPRGTTWVQTWHGTPLKKIAFDVARGLSAESRQRLAADIAKWDFLVSPNPFTTPLLRRALRYDGPILETGYPRNDALLAPDAGAVRARVRAALGVPDDVTAILYTPTWRDDQRNERGEFVFPMPLDLGLMAQRLSPGHTLLVRLPRGIAGGAAAGGDGFVGDVTAYPDVRDLYLACDVMVTDYSSTMFDFAVTGKPMLFYTYDLESYRDSLRGFYFDFEPLAPGPVLQTSGQVIAALQNLGEVSRHYAERYAAFRRLFTHLDDGHAGDRLRWLYAERAREPQLSGRD